MLGEPQQARLGLGPERRIRGKAAFEPLLRGGKRSSSRGFVFFLARREAGPPRLGILISRKHSAKATVRNYIKRCIREAFRLERSALAQLGAVDLLVRPPFGADPGPDMIVLLRGLLQAIRA
ncbi:MAG: ribonuclease P protein component [Betaproteobacteria bacterium]|nr:ribonuclease P protein component [Betaproteobacteria bacterium]